MLINEILEYLEECGEIAEHSESKWAGSYNVPGLNVFAYHNGEIEVFYRHDSSNWFEVIYTLEDFKDVYAVTR